MADALACVIIAFPVYLWVTRSILRELQLHPEKLESSVRKWLTYIALLIAAGIVVGDLITFLTYFLRGELTARFVAKVAAVLLIAGGVLVFTHKPFVYHLKSTSAYELCATFATDNRHQEPGEAEDAWRHPKGDFCFPLDATQSVPNGPYYY